MDDQDYDLTDDEQRVLRRLQSLHGQRFSIEELAKRTDLIVERAEKALFSLENHGLVNIRVTEKKSVQTEHPSLENSLLAVEKLLSRLSKLASKKGSTKNTVYDRVKERLNDELSKAIANLEFAADRTYEQLQRLGKEIEGLKDQIDEAALMVEIGEISAEEAERKTQEWREEIEALETQRGGILEAGSKAHEADVKTLEWREKESQRLTRLLEELEVRRQVGEFAGREGEFNAKRDQIVASLASLSEESTQENLLVEWAHSLAQVGRVLVDADVFLEETSDRLARACERIRDMSLSAKPDRGK